MMSDKHAHLDSNTSRWAIIAPAAIMRMDASVQKLLRFNKALNILFAIIRQDQVGGIIPKQSLVFFLSFFFITVLSGCAIRPVNSWQAGFSTIQENNSSASSGQLVVQVPHASNIASVAISPNGRYYASTSIDNQINIWSADAVIVKSYKDRDNLEDGIYYKLVFSSNSRYLTCVSPYRITIFDLETGSIRRMNLFNSKKNDNGNFYSGFVELSPDGNLGIALVSEKTMNSKLVLFRVDKDEVTDLLEFKRKVQRFGTFSQDGKYIVMPSGYDYTKGYIYTISTGEMKSIGIDDDMWIQHADIYGNNVIFTSKQENVYVYSLDGKLQKKIQLQDYFHSIEAIHLIKNTLVVGLEGNVEFVDIEAGRTVGSINGFLADVDKYSGTILVSHDSKMKRGTLSNGQNYEYQLGRINIDSLTEEASLSDDVIYSKIISNMIFATKADKSLHVWDINGKFINSITGVNYIEYRNNQNWTPFGYITGNNAVLAGTKETLSLIDTKSSAVLESFNLPQVSSVDASADFKLVVGGYSDGYVGVWATDGKLLQRFKAHIGNISHVSIEPNSSRILTVGDGVFKLWSVGGRLLTNGNCNDYKATAGKFTGKGSHYIIACGKKDVFSGSYESLRFRHHDSKLYLYDNVDSVGKEMNAVFPRIEDRGLVTNIYVDDRNGNIITTHDTTHYSRHYTNEKWEDFTNFENYIIWTAEGKFLKFANKRDRIFDKTLLPAEVLMNVNGPFKNIIEIAKDYESISKAGDFDTIKQVRISKDRKYLVAGLTDGTIRIINTKNQNMIFLLSRGNKWVMYSADGIYDSSIDGGDLLKIRKGAAVFSIDQFAVAKNRPDILLQRMELGTTEQIQHYRRLAQARASKFVAGGQGYTSIPASSIVQARQRGKKAQLELNFKGYNSPLKAYNIFINDVPLYGSQGKDISGFEAQISVEVELTSGKNKIEVSCVNGFGVESYRSLQYLNYDKPVKGDLYYVGLGVSKYKETAINQLLYAHKDAIDLGNIFKAADRTEFANVYAVTYTDEQVTRETIKELKSLLKNARVDDTFVLFIAGHGVHDTDEASIYYYITYDTRLDDLKSTAASFELIEDTLQQIAPRKKLFLMDTCESGELDTVENNALFASADRQKIRARSLKVKKKKYASTSFTSHSRKYLLDKDRYIYNNVARRSGAIVFSSSRGGEFSYEPIYFNKNENGYFTKELIAALQSGTSNIKQKSLSIRYIKEIVTRKVSERTKGLQNPTIDRDNLYQSVTLPTVGKK